MIFNTRKGKYLLPFVWMLGAASWKQAGFDLARLTKQKQQIQREVLRALPQTSYLGKYSYQGQQLRVKAYPTYFFSGSSTTLRQSFDITNHLTLDTTTVFAAIYVQDSLKLTAHKFKSVYCSFYPVNPPLIDINKGLGSRKLTDYDIVLMKAAAKQSATAFFLQFSALANAWHVPPKVMVFFEQDRLRFIDGDSKVYNSFEALATARFGGKEQFIQALEQEERMAKEGRVLLVD